MNLQIIYVCPFQKKNHPRGGFCVYSKKLLQINQNKKKIEKTVESLNFRCAMWEMMSFHSRAQKASVNKLDGNEEKWGMNIKAN